jgi:hypothetical protein
MLLEFYIEIFVPLRSWAIVSREDWSKLQARNQDSWAGLLWGQLYCLSQVIQRVSRCRYPVRYDKSISDNQNLLSDYPALLKVPKCEIFDRSDFHDFYPVKSLWEGDFGVKIKCFKKNI